MRVSSDLPDDVLVLHDALQQLREYSRQPKPRPALTLNLKNCGTALRFLQVHLEKCYPGEPITLTGDPRLMERDGKPTTQTTSARIMHGENIPPTPDESPYITMTRRITDAYRRSRSQLEADWSSAAFWYEYLAIHGGELLLEGLTADSVQGDRIVADIYAEHFGVTTTFTPEGAVLQQSGLTAKRSNNEVDIDFGNIPDLYPAVALTCERLGITLHATGTERLRFKESDRLDAVRLHEVRNDHRMAMALICADYITPLPGSREEKELQTIIAKSYPNFVEQFNSLSSGKGRGEVTHITPIKGINDDNLGKKHALSKLIHAATTEYVWLHDYDVIWPPVLQCNGHTTQWSYSESGLIGEAGQMDDLLILPLRMESEHERPSLLERLQIAEYAAIQELTVVAAKKKKAVMCSGANLIVKREVWLACEPDLHPEIPSGDDMFLLEAAKRRGYKVGVIDRHEYTAVVRPLTSWRAFFRQRMRWAGKAPHYTDADIRRCGKWIVALNIAQVLCPLIILFKFPAEYGLIHKRELSYPDTETPPTSWLVALLLELVYPFYLLVCLIGGLLRQRTW